MDSGVREMNVTLACGRGDGLVWVDLSSKAEAASNPPPMRPMRVPNAKTEVTTRRTWRGSFFLLLLCTHQPRAVIATMTPVDSNPRPTDTGGIPAPRHEVRRMWIVPAGYTTRMRPSDRSLWRKGATPSRL